MDDWEDLGLGRVAASAEGNEAFFRVISWPSGDEARAAVGLPGKDFHITVGFKTNDIHHKAKNQFTLLYA